MIFAVKSSVFRARHHLEPFDIIFVRIKGAVGIAMSVMNDVALWNFPVVKLVDVKMKPVRFAINSGVIIAFVSSVVDMPVEELMIGINDVDPAVNGQVCFDFFSASHLVFPPLILTTEATLCYHAHIAWKKCAQSVVLFFGRLNYNIRKRFSQ